MTISAASLVLPQSGQQAAMVLEIGDDLADELQEVVLENAHDVKAVGHDACFGEPPLHQGAVRAG